MDPFTHYVILGTSGLTATAAESEGDGARWTPPLLGPTTILYYSNFETNNICLLWKLTGPEYFIIFIPWVILTGILISPLGARQQIRFCVCKTTLNAHQSDPWYIKIWSHFISFNSISDNIVSIIAFSVIKMWNVDKHDASSSPGVLKGYFSTVTKNGEMDF